MIDANTLIDALYFVYEKEKNNIIEELNTEIAYMYLFNEKYELSHAFDPPWDCSGQVFLTGKKFMEKDYDTVYDFLQELNGQQKASYVSGCGLYAETLENDVNEIIVDMCYDLLKKTIKLLEATNPEYLSTLKTQIIAENGDLFGDGDIYSLIIDSDIVGDEICFDLPSKISDLIIKQKFSEVVNKYKNAAIKKHNKYLVEAQKRAKEEEKARLLAEKTWNKIEKLYKMFFNENIPKYLKKGPEYQQLMLLLQVFDEIPEKEINNVGTKCPHSFSNSVAGELYSFKRTNIIGEIINNYDKTIISDPIYYDSNEKIELYDVKRGKWIIIAHCIEDFGPKVSQILFKHKNYIDVKDTEINTLTGQVWIDTATVGIFFGNVFGKQQQNHTIEIYEHGIYTRTGWGDGCYNVYVKKDKKDQIIAIKIQFL